MYSLCGTPVSLERRSLHGVPVFLQFQPHERIFYDIFAPGNIGEMGLHHTKLLKWRMSAYAIHGVVIQTIDYSKTSRSRRNEQSIPPPMKNESPKPNEIY